MRAKPSERRLSTFAIGKPIVGFSRLWTAVVGVVVASLVISPLPVSAVIVPVDSTVPSTEAPLEVPTTDTPTDTTVASEPETVTSATENDATSSIIVKMVAGLDAGAQDAVIARHGGVETSAIAALRLHVLEVSTADLDAVIAAYRADTDVASVSLDRVREVESAASDPGYGAQWALPQIGWDQVHGDVELSGSVKIAVLDTGVAAIDELEGRLGAGYSAFGTDPTNDVNGHGTQMASIAAAATNNDAGIAGVAYGDVSVMPVQVLDANGEGADSDIIEGLVWAVDNGADVALMAFSNPGYSPALQDAINYAWYNGVVVVAAAGNDGSTSATYPAGSSKVIGVGGSTSSDTVWSSSNQSAAVYLTAPAVGISAIDANGDVVSVSGTSASAAIVAGAAAVLRGADASASNAVIVGRLARNAEPLVDSSLGNGRLNLARAVSDTSTDGVTPMGVTGSGGPVVGPYAAADYKPDTVSSPSLNEGASGSSTMTFNVAIVRSGNTNTNPFYWRVVTSGAGAGTATAGSPGGTCGTAGVDFIPPTAGTTIAATASSFTVSLSVCGDAVGEDNETIVVEVSDRALSSGSWPAGATVKTGTGTITNDDANTAPVNTVPGAQTTNEDSALVFSLANSNQISISDTDAGTGSLTSTLSVTNGTLTIGSTTGTSVPVTGTVAAINTAISTVTFTPTAEFSGSASLTILTSDGGNKGSGGTLTDSDSITITVNAVNDAPSFTKGANQTVSEDAVAQTVSGWATGFSPGPANESSQTLDAYVVTNDNNALFSVQPAIDTSGNLTYTPAPNASGLGTVSVRVRDSGSGTAPNVNLSNVETFTITVTGVNDAPSFTKGGDESVAEDSGARTVPGWATNISAGSGETGRVYFTLLTNNDALFSTLPAISASDATNPGQLTFTPAANAFGSATVSVTAYDPDGLASGSETFTITVTGVNDAPQFTKGPDQTVSEDAVAQTVNPWATGVSGGPNETETVTFTV
ncbi:MAG: hypothetical protein RL119_1357, partial [Actinomycetota bacterium]